MFAVQITDNAEVRPLEPWNAAEFLVHVDKARVNIEPYIPWAELVVDEPSARAFLQRYADRQAADGGRIYGIWLDGEPDRGGGAGTDSVLVGGLLFRTFDAVWRSCEIGVWLAPDAEGHGLVVRSAQRLIDWAIGERGMLRVEWRCVPANARSVAVARRLGMTHEGTLRDAFPYRGETHDLQVWAMIREEWDQRSWR